MTMRRSLTLMFCLFLPSFAIAGSAVTLDQTLHFKWKGLPVATMDFKVSLPNPIRPAMIRSSEAAVIEPKMFIEVTGRTRGPLSLVEDYRATVKYVQLDASGKNMMALTGQDNGQLEKREILFVPNATPQVIAFQDSTAKQALQPGLSWADDTSNPLDIFKMMLESSISESECAAQTWGYDGKRRYLLRLEPATRNVPRAQSSAYDELAKGEVARRYVCKITMYAKGRLTAASNSKPSIMASRLAALWPFGDGDRELLFDLWVVSNEDKQVATRLVLNEVQVATPLGAIIGRH